MPSIHENLKALRITRGMTQEEVAQKLHMTRQTVSGYESGRTQPDLDTLCRLSEIYEVDIHDLLYGIGGEQQGRRRIKITALLSWICAAGFGLLSAVPQWVANRYFWLSGSGQLGEAEKLVFQIRQDLEQVRVAGESLNLLSTRLFCLLLLLFSVMSKQRIPPKKVLLWLGVFTLCALGSVLPLGLLDPHVSLVNYTVVPWLNVVTALLAAILSYGINTLVKKRRET